MVRDLDSDIGRNSGREPTETEIKTDLYYDEVGNVIASIDGRGVKTEFEVNALNQMVMITHASSVEDVSSRHGGFDPGTFENWFLGSVGCLRALRYEAGPGAVDLDPRR